MDLNGLGVASVPQGPDAGADRRHEGEGVGEEDRYLPRLLTFKSRVPRPAVHSATLGSSPVRRSTSSSRANQLDATVPDML